ncbi:MAG: 30S ribosomal protein S20 [Firmicutes bacterium]|nr:30S ribosomal protein S20 [Bacillota bacterium]
MANIKSAQKRVNSSQKKKDANRMIRSQVSTAVKKFDEAVAKNDKELAEKLMSEAFAAVDSAAAKGVIHKNNADNKKSRMATVLHNLKTGKLVVAQKVDNKERVAARLAAEQAEKEARKAAAAEKAARKLEEKAAKEKEKKPVKKASDKAVKEKKEKPVSEKAALKEKKEKAVKKSEKAEAKPEEKE